VWLILRVVRLLSIVLFPGLVFAQAVKHDSASLRAGCGQTETEIATLRKGEAVKVRFALSTASRPCYAVTADVGGRQVQGYVWADDLAGMEQFDQARRKASAARPARASRAAAESEAIVAQADAAPGPSPVALDRAVTLLNQNQPSQALDILEAALRDNKRDAQLLALAGVAAHRSDDPRRAIAYWQDSLELRPDASIEKMCREAERELGADRSTQRSYGGRFLLRYDGEVADPELARSMVAALDQEFSRISLELGCPAEERIVTIVQSRASYVEATGAAEWNGGQYDGRIWIPLARSRQIDARTRRTFAHEIVHACLANVGRWPAWLHEGLAQKLSGDSLSAAQRSLLQGAARAGKLPTLSAIGNNWTRLGSEDASFRYALALAAAELFYQRHSNYGARNLMQNPERLPQIAADLDRALQETFGGR